MRSVLLGVWFAAPFVLGCATYHPRPLEAAALETAFRARTLDDAQLRSFIETSTGSSQSTWPPPDREAAPVYRAHATSCGRCDSSEASAAIGTPWPSVSRAN